MDQIKQIQRIIQTDPGGRGLVSDPIENLFTACENDFIAACQSIADCPAASVGIVTGFFIPTAAIPAAETDGPLGAVFLARAFLAIGIKVVLIADGFCERALTIGLKAAGIYQRVQFITLPPVNHPWEQYLQGDWTSFVEEVKLTHLISLERPGPNYSLRSLCLSMHGIDVTPHLAPAHLLFEFIRERYPHVRTIGIGDGGNEIGMGKIPRRIIKMNIARGDEIACRIATDFLIVAGVSNWGAYGLAGGVHLLRKSLMDIDFESEKSILEQMVEEGPLVDGVLGKQQVSVDGLLFDEYVQPLFHMRKIFSPKGIRDAT